MFRNQNHDDAVAERLHSTTGHDVTINSNDGDGSGAGDTGYDVGKVESMIAGMIVSP